jgi:hypothetical protein
MSRPPFFYKFCTAKVAKLHLKTRRLRFRSPLCFNDPFDCYFYPCFSGLRRHVDTLEKRHHAILAGEEVLPAGSSAAFNLAPLIGLVGTGKVPPDVIERTRKSHIARLLAVANEFNRESQFDWEEMLRRYRLMSLCAENKNPLLWSHYADRHRGAAFEFDASAKEGVAFETAMPVKYSRRVPCAYSGNDFIESALGLNPLPEAAQTLLPLVLTKSLEWSYEKEWRIVRVAAKEGQGLFADLGFSPRSLSRIFLGCRISIRSRRAIERLAAGDLAHVEIYQARQSQARFALEFDRVR